MTVLSWTCLWAIAGVAAGAAGADEVRLSKDDLPIPFYSGNLSVSPFMHYWGTHPSSDEPYDRRRHDMLPPDEAHIDQLRRTGCSAMTDYICWCWVEREEGVWDWSHYTENARLLREAGIDYVVFCWLHFPPKWYEASDRFVRYRNLETGAEIPQISLWSPDLPRVFDEFYARMAEALGDEIAFIRLAMPTEYGELGYCAGMTDWLRPQPEAGPGYWCGDPYAQAAFRGEMIVRYGSLEALNEAWGTDFATPEEVAAPLWRDVEAGIADSASARRRWTDFVDWYHDAWARSLQEIVGIVRKHFPDKEIVASLGYGSERVCYGNDQSRLIAKMGELGVACQSPGAIGYFPTRRVSTACRAYGVPYYTEPPGDVPREAQRDRIYMDLTNGVQVWFDYLQNLDAARDLFAEYGPLLTGAPPRTTVAVWHATRDHWLHPDQDWSPGASAIAEALRARVDYEIVDDRMIRDGALERLGVRHLILPRVDWLDAAAYRRVCEWVEGGGVLFVAQTDPAKTLDGEAAPWGAPAFDEAPDLSDVVQATFPDVPDAYRVDVSRLDHAALLTGTWYQPERPRWCAPGGGVTLPLASADAVRITVTASLHPEARPVQIVADGRAMAVAEPGHQGEISFDYLPREDAESVSLVFEGEGWTPAEVSDSPDDRLLCLYVADVRVAPAAAPDMDVADAPTPVVHVDAEQLWAKAGVRGGGGAVVALDAGAGAASALAEAAVGFFEQVGSLLGRPESNAPRIAAGVPGVLASMTEDAVLYYNTTQHEVRLFPHFRDEDFGGDAPAAPADGLTIPARSIAAIPIHAKQ